MNNNIYDVLVVGAGPSGSAAAITLAKQGHSVLLIDQYDFSRDKVCGDGLTSNCVRLLNNLGVWGKVEPETEKTSQAEVFYKEKKILSVNLDVHIIRRKKLDKILLDYAISCGATFKVLKFTGGIGEQENFCICEVETSRLEKKQIKAKFVLLATGCQPPDASKNIKFIKLKKPGAVAVRGYYYAEWDIKTCMAFRYGKYENAGYIWIFPMGKNEYNVGCGTTPYRQLSLKKDLNEFIEEFSKQRGASGYWISPPKGALCQGNLANLKYASFGRVLLVGDVLGATLPLTGEGIGMALATGILGAEVVHEALLKDDVSLLQNYKKRIKKELRIKYLPYRIGSCLFRTKAICKIIQYEIICKYIFAIIIRSIRFCSGLSLKKGKKRHTA